MYHHNINTRRAATAAVVRWVFASWCVWSIHVFLSMRHLYLSSLICVQCCRPSILPLLDSSRPPNMGSNPTIPTQYNTQATTQSKQNYKTELCRNYIKWTNGGQVGDFHCRYGKLCNYAHGEHELTGKVVKSPDTYLCLPCFDHVATGDWWD